MADRFICRARWPGLKVADPETGEVSWVRPGEEYPAHAVNKYLLDLGWVQPVPEMPELPAPAGAKAERKPRKRRGRRKVGAGA